VLWVLARRFCARWREHLAIVTPETVVRWHRQGWLWFSYWRLDKGDAQEHRGFRFESEGATLGL
jgi:hypothetical protein